MPIVVPVKFPYASRDLWFDPDGLDIVEGDYAICSTERGTEFGLVTADPFEVSEQELSAPLKPVLRIAGDEDIDRAEELADRGERSMADFRRLVKQNGLDMKPVGVEYLFGGERAVFYFAAEDRVDFRQLVKDLSSFFHMRVDMRQIGVRDETRLAGGYAQCGQELCCSRFGGQFEPVSIRMAKEQDLPLNSSKISGVCGRLMCCLRYEFEAYKDFKSRAPKKKTVVTTPLGKARIQEYDTPREQLVLRLESGKVFRVNLSDMGCSDACKKKAEEQGCVCRPDSVSREVLEKIESPDIALALLELDRENGVDVGDGLDQADRIITSGPTSRRRRDDSSEEGRPRSSRGRRRSSSQDGEADRQPQEGSGRRRRKRSGGSSQASSGFMAGAGKGSKRPAEQEAADGANGSGRRRRHHTAAPAADGAAPAQGAPAAPEEGSGSRRRRRRHSSASQKAGAASVKPDTPSVADQVADGEVKVTRRRPGDGGGQSRPASQDGSTDTSGGPQEKKRRRRRRSHKPRSGGEGGAAGASDAGSPSGQ